MGLEDRREQEPDVYQPAEDSHLLAEAACERLEASDLVLEVGTGSGYVAQQIADETGARVIASDLNPHAVRQARSAGVETVQADLVSPFRDGAFDAVVFNPPYLPTDPENEWDDWMERALSGGGGRSGRHRPVPRGRRSGGARADGSVSLLGQQFDGGRRGGRRSWQARL